MTNNQILSFTIEGELYGVDVKTVREVLEVQKITRVPGATENMLGIINVRGSIVPVLDLRNKISGIPTDITVDSAIVVMELPEEFDTPNAGFLVDSVTGVLDFDESLLEKVRVGKMAENSDFVKGIGKTGDSFTIILDGQQVIGAELPQDFRPEM